METAASQDLFRSASELLASIVERLDEMADKLADVEGELEDLREATGWLTVQEAAEHTSRSTYQVYRLLYEGEYNGVFERGVASKAKGQWRLHRGRLDRWLVIAVWRRSWKRKSSISASSSAFPQAVRGNDARPRFPTKTFFEMWGTRARRRSTSRPSPLK